MNIIMPMINYKIFLERVFSLLEIYVNSFDQFLNSFDHNFCKCIDLRFFKYFFMSIDVHMFIKSKIL